MQPSSSLPIPARTTAGHPEMPFSHVQGLINGRYVVDARQPLPGLVGGLTAFAVRDTNGDREKLLALQVRPGAPPQARALAVLADLTDSNMLVPIACGPAPAAGGLISWFMICRAPPGPALWPDLAAAAPAWGEKALVQQILRPAAAALSLLAERGVTHRAVRPDNIYYAGPGKSVVLGCGWAAPPGYFQPVLFEPPYLAMCAPACRGAGATADDVYALGVTLLTLTLGYLPLAGLSDEAIIARKLELGCFSALTAGTRLPPMMVDLLSSLLATDPAHRPTPASLADPAAARARRIATHPQRRATQALHVAGLAVWNARMLAYSIALHGDEAVSMLRIGVIDHWLRRALGDAALATRLEEPVRQRTNDLSASDTSANAMLVVRCIAVLDPLAPLCWPGMTLWPDALGPAIVAAVTDHNESARTCLTEIVELEATVNWGMLRSDHCDIAALRIEARERRAIMRCQGWAGGLVRLGYALNSLWQCCSPTLAGAAVGSLDDFLPALDTAAMQEAQRQLLPLDRDSAAFLAARMNGRGDGDLELLSDAMAPGDAMLLQLRVLARLQTQLGALPVPKLASWLLAAAAPQSIRWHSSSRRATKQAELVLLATGGDLMALLHGLDDAAERRVDSDGWDRAQSDAQRIDIELASVAMNGKRRLDASERLGREIAAALALGALAASAVLAAIG